MHAFGVSGAHTHKPTRMGNPQVPVRVYVDGIFDLFHFGHAQVLEQAKKCRPYVTLIAGVCTDEDTYAHKGPTVMTHAERVACVGHCKWVDEVIPDAPWIITQPFLDAHKIDLVAHDDIPYPLSITSGNGKEDETLAGVGVVEDVYAYVKKAGKFVATQRTKGISTSDLITRVVRNRDLYMLRNLQRGVRRGDLNISWVKATALVQGHRLKKLAKALMNMLVTKYSWVKKKAPQSFQKALTHLESYVKHILFWVGFTRKTHQKCRTS